MTNKTIHTFLLLGGAIVAGLAACTKESVNSNGKSPYGDPVLPAINFAEEGALTPAKGYVNDEVTIKGQGFLAVKDKLTVLFNGTAAPVVAVTDSTVKVKIPEFGSSGPITAQIGQEYYYGPFFPVYGPFQMDTLYNSLRGANSTINTIIPVPGDKYMIGGSFWEYDNSAIAGGVNRLARINADGTLDRTYTYGTGTGPTGPVSTIVYLADRKQYLVGGSFGGYDQVSHVYSIARVNTNGGVDQTSVLRPSGTSTPASALEGGFRGRVSDLYLQKDGKIMVVGDFRYYVKPNYNLTTVELGVDSLHLDSTLVYQIARLHPDGTLDSSYHYDLVKHEGRQTVNSFINRSTLLADDKLLIVGNFTTYNGQPAPRIARLNTDGSLDQSFNPGSGADQGIADVVVQPDGKIILAGNFSRFNGVKAAGIVRLNADGSVDPTFNVGDGADDLVVRIGLLPEGHIIANGQFRKFAGITRNNFVVLNADGSVHKTYNTSGGIPIGYGGTSKMLPIAGKKELLMVGSFTQFDYRTSNRIVKIKYQ